MHTITNFEKSEATRQAKQQQHNTKKKRKKRQCSKPEEAELSEKVRRQREQQVGRDSEISKSEMILEILKKHSMNRRYPLRTHN